jgi:periplasmic divalent cation tolerance protein
MKKFSFLYVTAPTTTAAKKIARTLLAEKLVACANILPQMTAMYYWQGKLEQQSEVVLLLKTQSKLIPKARARIQKIHPYKTPCIAELPVSSLNADYSQWLTQALTSN